MPDVIASVANRTRATIESEVLRQLAQLRLVAPGTREANKQIKSIDDGSASAVVKPDRAFHAALVDGLGSVRTSPLYRTLASDADAGTRQRCVVQMSSMGGRFTFSVVPAPTATHPGAAPC